MTALPALAGLTGLVTTQTSCVVTGARHFPLLFNLPFPQASLAISGFLLDTLFRLDFRDNFSNLEKRTLFKNRSFFFLTHVNKGFAFSPDHGSIVVFFLHSLLCFC
jgi:hypothetical protein